MFVPICIINCARATQNKSIRLSKTFFFLYLSLVCFRIIPLSQREKIKSFSRIRARRSRNDEEKQKRFPFLSTRDIYGNSLPFLSGKNCWVPRATSCLARASNPARRHLLWASSRYYFAKILMSNTRNPSPSSRMSVCVCVQVQAWLLSATCACVFFSPSFFFSSSCTHHLPRERDSPLPGLIFRNFTAGCPFTHEFFFFSIFFLRLRDTTL